MYPNDELFGTPQRLLMDPVHGGIPVFAHEFAVIDLPLFQRLRHIVQNDVVFLVFPGARHTRFEHSLGSMHIAGRFFTSVVRSYLVDPRRSRAASLSENYKDAILYFHWVVRLAALLHDTGHAPFSHQFEHSVFGEGLLREPRLLDQLWDGENWQQYYGSRPASLSHEHYSVRCALDLLEAAQKKSTLFPVAAVDVLSILETSQCEPSGRFKAYADEILAGLMPTKPEQPWETVRDFLRHIISGELDVDKMDYLLRDSQYSGTNYGFYNLDHLLNTLRFTFDASEGWLGLGIDEKGLGALEDFVHSRFQLYLNVIHHKTVGGFRWLLRRAIEEVADDKDVNDRIFAALASLKDLESFTDTFLWEAFRRVSSKKPGSACSRLLRREKLRYVSSARDRADFVIKRRQRELERQTGKKIVVWESDTKFSKLGEEYEELRVLVRDRATGRRHLEEVRHLTTFFTKFSRTRIVHFFEAPEVLSTRKRGRRKSV